VCLAVSMEPLSVVVRRCGRVRLWVSSNDCRPEVSEFEDSLNAMLPEDIVATSLFKEGNVEVASVTLVAEVYCS
jgi:hypothetical protein